MVGVGIPHHGCACLVQASTMLALGPAASTRGPVLAFDVIALSAFVIVVVDVAIVRTLRVERCDFRHLIHSLSSPSEHIAERARDKIAATRILHN